MKLSESDKNKLFARIYEALNKLVDADDSIVGLVIPVEGVYVKTDVISMLTLSKEICNLCFMRLSSLTLEDMNAFSIVPCLYCPNKFNPFPLHSMQFEMFVYCKKYPCFADSLGSMTHSVIEKIGDNIMLLDINDDDNNNEEV